MDIKYWHRAHQREEIEKVYGEAPMNLLYNTRIGSTVSNALSTPWFSQLYGKLQSTNFSARKIKKFVKSFSIPMHEYKKENYLSFNHFFIRQFNDDARKFTSKPNELAAFAEARYLGFESIQTDKTFPVKGKYLNAEQLLNDKNKAAPFIGGPLLIARLCPVDYHRFHFPDYGTYCDHYHIHGSYHSVSPIALSKRPEIFIENERQVSILETANFGKIAYIEVGALCVGKIVQSHSTNEPFKRGEEKGYFLFGGSTVIVLGEKGKWTPSNDILENTKNKREVYIQLGDSVARNHALR